ncbi:MAG: PIG-L deacetylase family protein [Candidatus Omnitrophota bacterium]
MKLRILVIYLIIALGWCTMAYSNQINTESQTAEISLNPQERILILAPHPDDEILGCGGIIQEAVKRNLPLKIVFLTYGDNNQWSFMVYRKRFVLIPAAVRRMGLIRHDEAIAAAGELGVPPENLIFLGYPDFRTLEMWYAHWGSRPAIKSMLTRVRAVPYKNAFLPGAPYKADSILDNLKTIIREFRPTKIFLSHPADHNPDHRSLYLFTRIALWDLENEIQPQIYPYLIHFKKWPLPKGYQPDSQLEPPVFFQDKVTWQVYNLTPEKINRNYLAIQKHKSQYKSSPKYLVSFIRPNQLFGDFPIVALQNKGNYVQLTSERKDILKEAPNELLDEERASFVGIEEDTVYLENDEIVFSIKLSRPLAEEVSVSLFVFGYKKNRDFSVMPKIHIKFGTLKHAILDQDTRLPNNSINVIRKPKEITLRVPLKLLDNPQYILTSVRTYTTMVPLDWVSWRILSLPDSIQ